MVTVGVFILFFVALIMVYDPESDIETVSSKNNANNQVKQSDIETNNTVFGIELDENTTTYLASALLDNVCGDDISCLIDSLEDFAEGMAQTTLSQQQVYARFNSMLEDKSWSDTSKAEMFENFKQFYSEAKSNFNPSLAERSGQSTEFVVNTDDLSALNALEQGKDNTTAHSNSTILDDYENYSVFKWIKGTLADFGLSLGWAALYFTVLTAWLNGQTLGKKIVGIRVIKLDGSIPGLWESFGRYGGYGAGFATGLSGFVQLCWDPNRQAIQDKISETLVIKVSK